MNNTFRPSVVSRTSPREVLPGCVEPLWFIFTPSATGMYFAEVYNREGIKVYISKHNRSKEEIRKELLAAEIFAGYELRELLIPEGQEIVLEREL